VRRYPVVGQVRAAGAGVRRLPPDGDVHVLGDVEGVEARLLGGAGTGGGCDPPRSLVNSTTPNLMATALN
jgi:hypothetical protein